MRHLNKLSIVFAIIVLIAGQPAAADDNASGEITIAMCRPLVSQIENIETLYQMDLIDIDKIKLLCVYHENEVTDYEPSFAYVTKNKLNWVKFRKVTGDVSIRELFAENVWTSQFKQIFKETDGIIFTGGMDIPPAIYGEESLLLTEATTPVRSMYESSFLFHLLGGSQNTAFTPFLNKRPNYPVLGICLGAQTMNVATGGTLYQDIPTEIYKLKTVESVLGQSSEKIHSSIYSRKMNEVEEHLIPAFHRIHLMKKSVFVKKFGMKRSDNPMVLSSHHQALETLGKGLTVTAKSMDGKVVEAVQHETFKNVLGVQFHPEYKALYTKGQYFKKKPGAPRDINLKTFLRENGPSMRFHKALWSWYSNGLRNSK